MTPKPGELWWFQKDGHRAVLARAGSTESPYAYRCGGVVINDTASDFVALRKASDLEEAAYTLLQKGPQ